MADGVLATQGARTPEVTLLTYLNGDNSAPARLGLSYGAFMYANTNVEFISLDTWLMKVLLFYDRKYESNASHILTLRYPI